MSVFDLSNDRLAINVPTRQFTDTVIDGWRITPNGTTAGRLDVVPWSEERILVYHARKRTHLRYGQRLRGLYRWLDPTGGCWTDDDEEDEAGTPPLKVRLAAWLDRRFAIHPPADRHKSLVNCMVVGPFIADNTINDDTAYGIRLDTKS